MRQQLPQDRAEWDKIAKDKVEDKKVSANESKVKGLGGQLGRASLAPSAEGEIRSLTV